MMEEHLAKGILGYKLHVRDVSDLEIEDKDVQRDRVGIRLQWKSLKLKT
ncbi:MAG: hypothetical protein QXZ66_01785 [Thermoproteota archaeon]